MQSTKHVRTSLAVAANGRFKGAVLALALAENKTLSQFVRDALVKNYPSLSSVNEYSEYALKRNIHLRATQEKTATDDDLMEIDW